MVPIPCGRFAPSPTGPLHFGSLVTALASFLEARSRKGHWLVRIEDLDPLRESATATTQILRSLESHQLLWDGSVRYQSTRHDAYHETLSALLADDNAYRCVCSRRELWDNGGQHPHHCPDKPLDPRQPYATRLRLTTMNCAWHDDWLGSQQQALRARIDDPVLQRKEGFYAYQLAVVIDDIDQGITDVVRGSDLLETTPAQLVLYEYLQATSPAYLHIPVILNKAGQKLSKQNHAPALDDHQPARNLFAALTALGQQPPPLLLNATIREVLQWAVEHWNRESLPRFSQTQAAPSSSA